MTDRDGTPLPWVGGEQLAGGYVNERFRQGAADNPLDQLCDALHIRRPRGVERVRAMDAMRRLFAGPGAEGSVYSKANWPEGHGFDAMGRRPDDPGIDHTLPAGLMDNGGNPSTADRLAAVSPPSGHVGG